MTPKTTTKPVVKREDDATLTDRQAIYAAAMHALYELAQLCRPTQTKDEGSVFIRMLNAAQTTVGPNYLYPTVRQEELGGQENHKIGRVVQAILPMLEVLPMAQMTKADILGMMGSRGCRIDGPYFKVLQTDTKQPQNRKKPVVAQATFWTQFSLVYAAGDRVAAINLGDCITVLPGDIAEDGTITVPPPKYPGYHRDSEILGRTYQLFGPPKTPSEASPEGM